MKVPFRYSWFGLFFVCYSPGLLAKDTLLVNIFELPNTIINLVMDENGRMYYSDRVGVYEFHRDGKVELVNGQYQDELLIENGQLYLSKNRDWDYPKIQQYWESQELIWKERVFNFNLNHQLSSVQEGPWVWVAFKNTIYQFLILENAQIRLSGHPTRVIQLVDNHLIAGTYRGLFLNNELLDFCHFDGFASKRGENIYFASGAYIYLLNLDSRYINLFMDDLDILSSAPSQYFNYTSYYENPNHSIFLGTDKGLIQLDSNWNFVQSYLENLIVEYIGDYGEGLWICTSEGMYSWSAQHGISKVDLKDIGAPNHFYQTNDRLLIAASNGFFEFLGEEHLTHAPEKIQIEDDLIEFYRIEEGKPGEFWVSSEKGLHLYRPEQGTIDSSGGSD